MVGHLLKKRSKHRPTTLAKHIDLFIRHGGLWVNRFQFYPNAMIAVKPVLNGKILQLTRHRCRGNRSGTLIDEFN